MRLFFLLCLMLANPVWAFSVTYSFGGHITSFDFSGSGGSISDDPSVPLIKPDGTVVFNGITDVSGYFTIDLTDIPLPYSCASLPLSYQLSTEGATYYRQEAPGCTDALYSTADTLAWHVEGPSLTNQGGLESSIQDFVFNFSNGVFIGGEFKLDYMFDPDLDIAGSISGVINSLQRDEIASVPESSALSLVVGGLLGLSLVRRKKLNLKHFL